MLTLGLFALGGLALLSMAMMIGTVFAKSPYAKYWAMLGGASVLLAGALVVLQAVSPTLEAGAEAGEPDPAETYAMPDAKTKETEASAAVGEPMPTGVTGAGLGGIGEDKDLAFLAAVMELLKAGKPLPPEYLALLPDGGQGILAAQSKTQTATQTQLSKPLQTQLVAIDRSQGSTRYAGNSYVPSTKPSTQPSGGSTGVVVADRGTPAPATGGTATPVESVPGTPPSKPNTGGTPGTGPNTPPASGGSNGGGGTQTPPPPPPVTPQEPAPAPPPPVTPQEPAPAPAPPPSNSTGSLVEGSVFATLLGASKTSMEDYFMYNQYLGQSGNTYRYLRGDRIVEVTLSGNQVTRVKMTWNSFQPSGRDMAFYEDMMRTASGMSQTSASSRSGQDIAWNGVYPGASSILFHIDTSANFGYVVATL